MHKLLRVSILVAMIAISFLLSSSVALANNTPSVCDSEVKYYCSYVNYDANVLGGWNINHRYYKGGRDGGAQRWQLYYARDWYWGGSEWVLQTDWGQSGWNTNIPLDGSCYGSVTMRTRYYECTDHCYYWCSNIMEHDLWLGSSLQFGNNDCSTN